MATDVMHLTLQQVACSASDSYTREVGVGVCVKGNWVLGSPCGGPLVGTRGVHFK